MTSTDHPVCQGAITLYDQYADIADLLVEAQEKLKHYMEE